MSLSGGDGGIIYVNDASLEFTSLGAGITFQDGTTLLTKPDESSYTLESITNNGASSPSTIDLTNSGTSLQTAGDVAIGSSDPSGTRLHVTGNVFASNAVVTSWLHGDGSNITGLPGASNSVAGQVLYAAADKTSNGVPGLTITLGAIPGTDANTLTMSGDIVTTNLRVTNNLQVTGTVTQIHTDNLTVTDPIVALNEDNTQDATTGFVFNRGYGVPGAPSNVMIAVCSTEGGAGALDEHLVLARTEDSSFSDTLDPTGDLEVNVFGNTTVSGNIVGTWLHGDGSNLTGLVSDLQSVVDNGNTLVTNKIHFVDAANIISPAHAMFGSNTDAAHANVHVVGNVFVSNALETNAIHMTHADLTGVVIKTASSISPSVAIGRDNAPGAQSVAIGDRAGASGAAAVAVGPLAGEAGQSGGAVAVGLNAGRTTQGAGAVAVGSSAGRTGQDPSTVAIGAEAGRTDQETGAVALGYAAGKTTQGSGAVAIGKQAGETDQHAHSIVINASGVSLNTGSENAFYISSVRLDSTNTSPLVSWNLVSNEVVTIAGMNAIASNASLELSGNLYASNLYGNGAALEGIITSISLQEAVEDGNSTTNTVHFANTTAFSTAGNVTLGSNIDTDTTLHVTGNVFTTGNINTGTGTSVGIGTTAQSSVLSVVGTNPYNPEPLEAGIHIGQAGTDFNSFVCIELVGPENRCLIDFSRPGATGEGGQQLYRLISNRVEADNNFEMIANDTKVALSIDPGGNVAIGGRTSSMGANLQVTGNVVVYGGSQEFTNPTTDSAVYTIDYAQGNTFSINVVDSTPSNITALEVSNTGNIHMTQNLAVGNSVTTNVIYFGTGGSVSSSGGLDLNGVVSRGAVSESNIFIDTGGSHSLNTTGESNLNTVTSTSIKASSLNLAGLPTSAPSTVGDVWNDNGVLKIVIP